MTNNALKEDQKAQLRAELETKRKEANCIIPVVVAPVPKDGLQVQSPASVRISIKHGIDATPKDWVISWAPLQKPGEWPTPSVQQNISLNGLTTKQGVTTGILNVVKPGRWSVITKVDIPSYCNIGLQAIPGASFIVTDRSAGESAGEILKDKRPGPLQTPKEGNTGIAPTLQQKQTFPSQQQRR